MTMDECQLEHLIRASGAIIGDTEVIVVGSQSIVPWLKKYRHCPILPVLTQSMEADIIPIDDDERKSDLIDGAIGEESHFSKTFGVYAQGVSRNTVVAPDGWLARCYRMVSANTHQVVGHCMHPADLFIAKTAANREKDGPFLDAMIAHGLVQESSVLHLLPKLSMLPPGRVAEIRDAIRSRFARQPPATAYPPAAPR
jgi:hypothetical protein